MIIEKRNVEPEPCANFIQAVMQHHGPLICQILTWKIAGEAARSELEELAEPLKRMVFCQPYAKAWLSDALYSQDFPSTKVSAANKRVWLQKIMAYVRKLRRYKFMLIWLCSLRGGKGTNQMVKDFWIQCRGSEFAYTL